MLRHTDAFYARVCVAQTDMAAIMEIAEPQFGLVESALTFSVDATARKSEPLRRGHAAAQPESRIGLNDKSSLRSPDSIALRSLAFKPSILVSAALRRASMALSTTAAP